MMLEEKTSMHRHWSDVVVQSMTMLRDRDQQKVLLSMEAKKKTWHYPMGLFLKLETCVSVKRMTTRKVLLKVEELLTIMVMKDEVDDFEEID